MDPKHNNGGPYSSSASYIIFKKLTEIRFGDLTGLTHTSNLILSAQK